MPKKPTICTVLALHFCKVSYKYYKHPIMPLLLKTIHIIIQVSLSSKYIKTKYMFAHHMTGCVEHIVLGCSCSVSRCLSPVLESLNHYFLLHYTLQRILLMRSKYCYKKQKISSLICNRWHSVLKLESLVLIICP